MSSLAPRVVRSFVQEIRAPLEEVFPLLCPEREKEWLPGWDARMIYSASGVAEGGAVFETRHDPGRTLWVVTEYDRPRRVAFVRWQPDGVLVHIQISLERKHADATAVGITYTYTAVDENGVAVLGGMSEDAWLKTMAFWQESMNTWFENTRRGRAAASR